MKRIYLKEKYDWNKIQTMYNNGLSLVDIANTGITSTGALLRGRKSGYLVVINDREKISVRYKHKRPKHLTLEHKNKISETVSEKVKNNNWHYSFSNIRTYKFNSKYAGKVNLMGLWELRYAEYLDSNNIKWRRPTEKFKYCYQELKRGYGFYTPDFYLIDKDVWVEIKGFQTNKDTAKWEQFPHTLKVLKGRDLKHVLNLNVII